MPSFQIPDRVTLDAPFEFIERLMTVGDAHVDIDCTLLHLWALTALAAHGRMDAPGHIAISSNLASSAGRFAHELGLEEVLHGGSVRIAGEGGRTVCMRRVTRFGELEQVASEISHLVAPTDDDIRQALYFILVELLRNAVQHSHDTLGAVVGAQRMHPRRGEYANEAIQISVADRGVGVFDSLQRSNPSVASAEEALTLALLPHVSGAFARGAYPSYTNAGLGLYYVSEFAKKTAGRFLISSHGASLLLKGDPEHLGHHRIETRLYGFEGTLTAFELPPESIADYEGLMAVIQEGADRYRPHPNSPPYVAIDSVPTERALAVLVRIGAEDTQRAIALVNGPIMAAIRAGKAIHFDFDGVPIVTQSYLHSLLYPTLLVARDARVSIHATNCSPSVRASIRFLESYAPPIGTAS